MPPLFPGKKNIGKNIDTEESAGKPKKQALAIALNVARRNKKPKKMAKGGEITADSEKRPMPDDLHDDGAQTSLQDAPKHQPSGWLDNKKEAGKSGPRTSNQVDEDFVTEDMTDIDKAHTAAEMNMEQESSTDPKHINQDHKKDMPQMLAEGGEVEDHYDSIADAILAKKRRASKANDDMADVSLNATEEPNNQDDLSWDALRKENYSETPGLEALDSPMDSGQHGDTLEDEDEHGGSLVDAIRRKSKKRA